MIDLSVSSCNLTISCFPSTVVVTIDEVLCKERLLDNFDVPPPKNKSTSDDGGIPVISSTFSSCGTLFACCSHKSLSIWNVNDWSIVHRKAINRSVSKIMFSPKNDNIVVADKSGDVYLHSVNNFDEPGLLILGHVSMLLDISISSDGKYIITCDRDEKIRVSHYPNAYNIESYCLGHAEFVTSLNFLPHESSVLLSSSGDGTLRLWDYVCGKELQNYTVNVDNKKEEALKIGFDGRAIIILKTCVIKLDPNISLIFSLIHSLKGVLVHSIAGDVSNLQCELIQCLNTSIEPLWFTVTSDRKLWVLVPDCEEPILFFEHSSDVFQKNDKYHGVNKCIKKHCDLLELNLVDLKEKFVNALYKKKFDDESAYLKRKTERIELLKVKKKITSVGDT